MRLHQRANPADQKTITTVNVLPGRSIRLLEGTVQLFSFFVTNKFKLLSSCVICLVIAREIFLPQPDCSVITKVHDFSLLLYN